MNGNVIRLACLVMCTTYWPVAAQPIEYIDLGQVEAPTILELTVHLSTATTVQWYRVIVERVAMDAGFIDLWTLRNYDFPRQLGLPGVIVFNSSGQTVAYSYCVSYNEALVSFGLTDPRPPIVVPDLEIEPSCLNPPLAGQHGPLASGVNWIALGNELVGGPDNWHAVSLAENSPGRETTFYMRVQPADAPFCDADFNWDGNVDQEDVRYLVNVIAGGPNETGRWADYNRDGNEDMDDVLALIHTIAGGGCP